ncbi:MAG: nitrate/nitrite transporter NrtS [Actinomycetota bacterium]
MQEVRPTWATWREALVVVRYRPHLLKTFRIAMIVGTIIFSINQLDIVIRHKATTSTYLKGALTYLVPFCVSNYGILVASHRRKGSST